MVASIRGTASHAPENALREIRKLRRVLKVAKFYFGLPEVNFLGTQITRTASNRHHPKLAIIKKLSGFLSTINFYKRFIKDAAKLLAPLNALLQGPKIKNTQPFNWTPELEELFAKIPHDALPIVLLGLRSVWKEDFQTTSAEHTYGESSRKVSDASQRASHYTDEKFV